MPKTLNNLPKKVIFCKKCVISNQRPQSHVEFLHDKKKIGAKYLQMENDGICSPCKVWKINNSMNCFAKRFAAKEAFSKALGTGISNGINFNEIVVLNKKSGKPYISIIGQQQSKANFFI